MGGGGSEVGEETLFEGETIADRFYGRSGLSVLLCYISGGEIYCTLVG